MPYRSTDHPPAPGSGASPLILKMIIAGGFGAGKTTMIGAVSEIEPLTTEEGITTASAGIDNLSGVPGKTTTTVALDFGRLTLNDYQPESGPGTMSLYLFGVPGQERLWGLWNDLEVGAVGAVVLVDTRRLEDSFAAVGWYEQRSLPYVIGINEFDGADRYPPQEVRQALGLPRTTPILSCDVRERSSARRLLLALAEHALAASLTTPSGVTT